MMQCILSSIFYSHFPITNIPPSSLSTPSNRKKSPKIWLLPHIWYAKRRKLYNSIECWFQNFNRSLLLESYYGHWSLSSQPHLGLSIREYMTTACLYIWRPHHRNWSARKEMRVSESFVGFSLMFSVWVLPWWGVGIEAMVIGRRWC